MADTSVASQKRMVIEALVLAFANSQARDIVGTDALRSVLEVEYHELVSDGVINLQPLWELLEQQPGFEAPQALAPVCAFKSWEKRLAIQVQLPDSLSELTQEQTLGHAAECAVPRPDLNAVFRGTAGVSAEVPAAAKREQPKAKKAKKTKGTNIPAQKAESARRPAIAVVAGVIGVACLAFAGVTLYKSCATTTGKWAQLAPAQISSSIPIASADRLGKQVRVTLSDDKWLSLDKEERSDQLKAALRKLESREIDSLVILDSKATVRADARLLGRTGELRVTFR